MGAPLSIRVSLHLNTFLRRVSHRIIGISAAGDEPLRFTHSALPALVMGPPVVRCENMSHSSFYTMIPSAVRSRIPVLASLRRSARAIVLQSSSPERNARTLSCVNATNEKEFYGFAVTVPSSGASTPMIRPETPNEQLSTQELSLRTLPQAETSTGIDWDVAGVLLILPIIMAFLNRIMQYERQHQVTERVLANGLDLTSALGERSIELQNALTRFKDGRLGGACVDAGSWLVEGILGGVNDGVDAVAQSRRRAP